MDRQEALLKELDRCVSDMEEETVGTVAEDYLRSGFDSYTGIEKGLAKGMEEAGRRYEASEYFVPELLICADAMYRGLDVLQPHLEASKERQGPRVVLGVVQGDCHDIGKNLVKAMLEGAGCEVIDLGKDVAPERFAEAVRRSGAEFLGMSTLMSTTMDGMRDVVALLKEEGLRDRVRIMVGGGPVTESFAREIGADLYAANAAEAARGVMSLAKSVPADPHADRT